MGYYTIHPYMKGSVLYELGMSGTAYYVVANYTNWWVSEYIVGNESNWILNPNLPIREEEVLLYNSPIVVEVYIAWRTQH